MDKLPEGVRIASHVIPCHQRLFNKPGNDLVCNRVKLSAENLQLSCRGKAHRGRIFARDVGFAPSRVQNGAFELAYADAGLRH